MATVMIKDFISGEMAVSYEDGQKCFQKVLETLDELNEGEKVHLNFSGVKYVITAFLNPVIGDLIIERGIPVMKSIVIENANQEIIDRIKLVKDGTLLKREDLNL